MIAQNDYLIEKYALEGEMVALEKRLTELKTKLTACEKKCLHIHKNGKSSIYSGFFMNSCELCSWNDL